MPRKPASTPAQTPRGKVAARRSQRTPSPLAQQSTLPVTNSGLLTAKQEEAMWLLGGPQRHTLLVGGSRSGKTFALVRAVVIRALKAPNSRHVIFRLRSNALRASIWLDTLPKVMRLCFPNVKLDHKHRDGYVEFPNGSQLWFGGLDDKERVEKILGMEFCTVYFNECSQIKFASVLVGLTRLAQKVEGLKNRVYYDLNPTGTAHWTYRLFVMKVNPETRLAVKDPENYALLFMNPADNREYIDKEYIELLESLPEAHRRRFLDGKYVNEIDGALWSIESLEQVRVDLDDVPKSLHRVVVAVDPSGCMGEEDERSDEIGIIGAGRFDGQPKPTGYLLRDASGRFSPEQWGQRAVALYKELEADAIVAEINFGGDMVRAVIHGVDPNVPVNVVRASRGKVQRAEPVSALFDQQRVYVAGSFPLLEDQLCNFSTAGYLGDKSPDRADAMVWAFHDLFLGEHTTGLLDFMREIATKKEAA